MYPENNYIFNFNLTWAAGPHPEGVIGNLCVYVFHFLISNGGVN